MIEIKNLKKKYIRSDKREILALNDINLHVNKGEIFGLIGANGAGKTTLIKVLTSTISPSYGQVLIDGIELGKNEKQIQLYSNYVLGGETGLYRRLTAYDNLLLFGALYKVKKSDLLKRIPYLLNKTGLTDVQNVRVEEFSKGMIQRLHIARCLINNPKIIYFDEPTIGLDPLKANELHNLIFDLKEDGRTMLITSHYMDEIEKLCDRIAIIKNGEIKLVGTSEEIKTKVFQSTTHSLTEVFMEVNNDQ